MKRNNTKGFAVVSLIIIIGGLIGAGVVIPVTIDQLDASKIIHVPPENSILRGIERFGENIVFMVTPNKEEARIALFAEHTEEIQEIQQIIWENKNPNLGHIIEEIKEEREQVRPQERLTCRDDVIIDICPTLFDPVCAYTETGEGMTYPNVCEVCQIPWISFYMKGECPDNVVPPESYEIPDVETYCRGSFHPFCIGHWQIVETKCVWICDVTEPSSSKCGDGVCEEAETTSNCPNDCKVNPEPYPPICRYDEDCPIINCIKAPCPQYKCIDEKCIFTLPSERGCVTDIDCVKNIQTFCGGPPFCDNGECVYSFC